MDSNTLRALEYDRIKDALNRHVACEIGAIHVDQLQPISQAEEARRQLMETTECRDLLDAGHALPFGGLSSCDRQLHNAAAGGSLAPDELVTVCSTLIALRRLHDSLNFHREKVPHLWAIASHIQPFPDMEAAIARCISENGEILDAASTQLARVRNAIRLTRRRLTHRLESILHNSAYKLMIQDTVLVQRSVRECIPIKAEYRSQFPGLVHDQSASGQTLFMEPMEAVEIGNEVRSLELDEQTEIRRILKDLSGMVGNQAKTIQNGLNQAGLLDFISARAFYSRDLCGVAVDLNNSGLIVLNGARHPLLTGEVVPLNIEMDQDQRTLIITGPNTGGKTVALKTVGLLCLMAQSGLHIPADPGSQLPFFSAIFADIGDEQSISQNLSTFSGHICQIVNILQNLQPNSMVLLDELGAGTDPVEGSALAAALIEHLTNRDARTIVTTHYGELKELAYHTLGVANASVQFDDETLSPTYHLQVGIPGRSLALIIAARLGLPEELVEKAQARISPDERSAGEMLRQMEQDQREAAEARRKADEELQEATRLRSLQQKELNNLERKKRDILVKAVAEAQYAVQQAQEEARTILAELRNRSEKTSGTHKATEALGAMDRQLLEVRRKIEDRPTPIQSQFHPKVGDSVHVPRFGQYGIVVEVESAGEVTVSMGSLRMKLSVNELEPAPNVAARSEPIPGHAIRMEKAATTAPELKLIGLRAEEALSELDKYLDDAMLSGMKEVRIIHGKGTGALRNAVWEWVRGHHAVQAYRQGRDGEGGSGATIVELVQG